MVGKATIAKLWKLTEGKAWEPPDPNSQLALKLIEAGYVRRADGICGFERIKDAMLVWTEAGKEAARFATQEGEVGG